MRWNVVLAIGILLLSISDVQADNVATITAMKGNVIIVGTDGVQRTAKVNDSIMPGETIRTSNNGAVEILLSDNSKVSVGGRAVLDPGEILKFNPNPEEPSLLRRFFKWIGPLFQTTDPRKVHIGGAYISGPRAEINTPRTEYIASITRENDIWVSDFSVLHGELTVDGVDYASLPDRYFVDPLNKCAEQLNSAAVLAEISPNTSAFELLSVGSPVTVQAGFWTRIEGIGPPLPPQLGIAPAHVGADSELTIPEPSCFWLCGIFILCWVVRPASTQRSTS